MWILLDILLTLLPEAGYRRPYPYFPVKTTSTFHIPITLKGMPKLPIKPCLESMLISKYYSTCVSDHQIRFPNVKIIPWVETEEQVKPFYLCRKLKMKIWSTWKFRKLLSLFPLEAAYWDLLHCSSFTLPHVVSTEGARTASTCWAQQPYCGDNWLLPAFKEVIKPRIILNSSLWVDQSGMWEEEEDGAFLSCWHLWTNSSYGLSALESSLAGFWEGGRGVDTWKLLTRFSAMGQADSCERRYTISCLCLQMLMVALDDALPAMVWSAFLYMFSHSMGETGEATVLVILGNLLVMDAGGSREEIASPFPVLPSPFIALRMSCVSTHNIIYKMDASKIFRGKHSVWIHQGLAHRFNVLPPVSSV